MEKSEESRPAHQLNAPKASRKEWIGLAVLALPCVLYSMDLTVLNLALPSLSATLKPSSSQLLWIVDIYGFMVAGWLITMGTLGDRIGRRKLLMIGAAAFGAASVLAAFSTSSSMLIATRALLGIAGATLAPSTLSLISNMFHDPRQRTFAIGVWATSYSVGGAVGPLIGGLMLQHFWWGSVFLIGVPVMVLLLILGPQLLPEFHSPKAERIDLLSVALSLTSILSIIYSMKQVAQDGIGWLPLSTFLIGIIVGVIFIRRQRILDHPFIDLALFRKSTFNTALATNTFTMFVAFGSFFFIAQYLQLVLGLSPFQAGLWTMPSSLGFVAGSMFTPMLVRYLKPAYVISAGLLLASIGFVMFTQIDEGGLVLLVIGSVVMSLGVCPAIILSTDLIVGAAQVREDSLLNYHEKSDFFISFSLVLSEVSAQTESKDTLRILEEVIIKAYASDRPLMEVPASIALVDTKELNRFNTTSLLPALNTVPGVRMEERSPGSYRLSIRGSTLRSPFGVRNVKVYWNSLPLTDGGGNTYLNSLDFSSVTNIEVIKGPGASLYGAGTGGVLLLNNQLKKEVNASLHFMVGSYGLIRYGGSAQMFTKKTSWKALVVKQHSEGYRKHTVMSRVAAQVEANILIGKKSTLSTLLFSSDLKYETPGGLTKNQYTSDPRQARPETATQPAAVEQKAAVNNKTIYSGIVHEINWNEQWFTRTGIYGSYNDFKNPSIRNYEKRWEGNIGGRTETHYKFKTARWKGKFTVGAEFQYFYSTVEVYDNDKGKRAQIQLIDTLSTKTLLGFLQAEFDLPKEFYLTIGGSSNFLRYHFERSAPTMEIQDRKFDTQISPRVALLKKILPTLSVYSSVSYGFSPPTLAEVRPSTGNFNATLNAEKGVSYEIGLKRKSFEKLTFDVALYHFQLRETIVIQRTSDGAEYFINAGATSQKGMEANLSWQPVVKNKYLSSFVLWGSYTLADYKFKDYINDGQNHSGNLLTGVAPNTVIAGLDVGAWKKMYAHFTCSYSDHIPVNDANSEYATDYFLIGIRCRYEVIDRKKFSVEVSGGIDNIYNTRYSLGNDLNAAGARYYNAAAGRNFYGGINFSFL